jgi:hypothetical protein
MTQTKKKIGAWFVCLFVYSRTSSFSAIWRLSPLPVTWLQILVYARRSGPLSRDGSLSCHTYCDTGPRFRRSHLKDRHLRPTVGFEPLTQGSSDHCARRSNHCATQAIRLIYIFLTYFHSKLYNKQISKTSGTCKSTMMFKTLLFSNILHMSIEIFVTICHFSEKN